jgi:hypothetical protein
MVVCIHALATHPHVVEKQALLMKKGGARRAIFRALLTLVPITLANGAEKA